MKVESKLVFLFRDSEGFGSAIFDSLAPNPPNPASLDERFELSLERYGIKDIKASGIIHHFVDYKVSVLLMQNYEPPVLACAVNEVLEQIVGENPSPLPEILAPFVVPSSKLKWDGQTSGKSNGESLVYGVQIGPGTETTKALASKTEKPSPTIQIHHEPLACLLHLARVTNFPGFFLIGESGRRKQTTEDLEILHEVGDILASALGLGFSKERIQLDPKTMPKNAEEPWRALYG